MPLREVNLDDRADAEYFSKENRAIEKALREHAAVPLRKLGTLVGSAFYPAAADLYETGDVPFARCVDCINHPVITKEQDAKFVRVPSSFVASSKQIDCVTRGDIIITKVGSPCFASIVHNYDRIALSRTVLGLVRIHDINPYYLAAFLRCRFGFNQLFRQREQTIQFQLTLERVRDVLVYRASEKLQNAVEQTLLAHIAALATAHNEAGKSESLLLSALGLNKWRPPKPLTYTRRAGEALAVERLDAEYFQPKYDAMLKKIADCHILRLGELVSITKSVEPGSDYYLEEGDIPFLRIAELSRVGIDRPGVFLSRKVVSLLGCPIPKPQTILLSKDGTAGIAYVHKDDDPELVTSGGILHLSVTHTAVLPEYLALVLNSIVGQMQTERDAGGSIIQHWRIDQIKDVQIPVLAPDEQQRLIVHIDTAHAARRAAQEKLERAKRAVEIAIEQSEEKALQLLNSV